MLSKLKYLCIFFVLSGFSLAMAVEKCNKAPEEWLYVITADRFELEGDTLTLFKKSDDVIGFTDRPYRKQMHLTFQEFAKSWDQGEDSFKGDPPNAYLTWEDTSGDKPTMRAIELILLDIDTSSATQNKWKFGIRHWKVNDNAPARGEAVSLFIDGSVDRSNIKNEAAEEAKVVFGPMVQSMEQKMEQNREHREK